MQVGDVLFIGVDRNATQFEGALGFLVHALSIAAPQTSQFGDKQRGGGCGNWLRSLGEKVHESIRAPTFAMAASLPS